MRWSLRVSLVVFAGSLGCVGGPVSDWPGKNHDDPSFGDPEDESTSTPPPRGGTGSNAGRMDAGAAAPTSPADLDGADDGSASDGGAPCAPDASACRASCLDAGAPTVVDPTATARLGCPSDPSLSD
ncbi:MAG: hypothetical protein ABW252_26115 [Polyangiales bacterium]